jgi:putative DNA primase/helicase
MIEFADYMIDRGYEPPQYIPTGKIFRFGANYVCWGILFDDRSGGVFGNWKTGEEIIWQSKKTRYTPYEKEQFAAHIKATKALEDAKREELYAKAAERAQAFLDGAKQASPTHPYLIKKQIKPHGVLQSGANLIVPVYDVLGDLMSYQSISPSGSKRFFSGGKVAGGMFFLGNIEPDYPILICEGFATAASIFEEQDEIGLCVVAFNAGNLKPVAQAINEAIKDCEIVIAGDVDEVGKKHATEAASAVKGKVIFPPFKEQKEGLTDWNDFLNLVRANHEIC